MWRRFLRPLLFCLDAERAHRFAMALFAFSMRLPCVRALVRWRLFPREPVLRVRRFGRELASPIGLAAGFDKDARWFDALSALGFSFVEVGTVTARPQPGNPRPRLFRLPADRALVNRFGFNNLGAQAMARALARARSRTVLGVNIGKSKATPNAEAAGDYVESLERLWPFATYFAVNVSSPNTAGLRDLQAKDELRGLLGAITRQNAALAKKRGAEPLPVLVKIAPDLLDPEVDDVVDLALDLGLAGVIATNTTTSREGLVTAPDKVQRCGPGGLSGAPLASRARAVVERVYSRSGGRLLVIGSGGVLSAEDAWELFRAGASLVEIYTGLIYEGPTFVRALSRGLARKLRERGQTLDEVIGESARARKN